MVVGGGFPPPTKLSGPDIPARLLQTSMRCTISDELISMEAQTFMLWNPHENSDQENLRWCWLRAVEWGKWPLFVSQPLLPLMLFTCP